MIRNDITIIPGVGKYGLKLKSKLLSIISEISKLGFHPVGLFISFPGLNSYEMQLTVKNFPYS